MQWHPIRLVALMSKETGVSRSVIRGSCKEQAQKGNQAIRKKKADVQLPQAFKVDHSFK